MRLVSIFGLMQYAHSLSISKKNMKKYFIIFTKFIIFADCLYTLYN